VTTFLSRVSLSNYKSIAQCDVQLRPLTVLVGQNGSGKSNFVDAPHFVADSLRVSLTYAMERRGGFKQVVRHRSGTVLQLHLWFRLKTGITGEFGLEIDRGLVRTETLSLTHNGIGIAQYARHGSSMTAHAHGEKLAAPAVLSDRLGLVALSGFEAFREAYDSLAAMHFYQFDPVAMRNAQDPSETDALQSDGSNIASVWRRLQQIHPDVASRLTDYVGSIVPGVRRIRHFKIRPKETLKFEQASDAGTMSLTAASMSDGTLRALGALVASRQGNETVPVSAVFIEEPETALHPGAVAVLMDAFREASQETQIVITSHSPDVLDHVNLDEDSLLVTEWHDAATVIAPVSRASEEAVRRHLYTPGELLRMGQLQTSGLQR
jgi:predicted ATPase